MSRRVTERPREGKREKPKKRAEPEDQESITDTERAIQFNPNVLTA